MKKWLQSLLNQFLPAVEKLGHDPAGRAEAERQAAWMKAQWTARGLTGLTQQKNPMTEARQEIKKRLGEDHVALLALNFTEAEWRSINNAQADRVDERSAKLIDHPDQIVERATTLLTSHDWSEIAAGLAVVTGRRLSELLSTMRLTPKSAYSVIFSGALKRRGEKADLSFEIPTLCPAERVLAALARLRELVDAQGLSPDQINAKYSAPVIRAVDNHFADLVPVREGHDNLYTHLQRAVYAALATYYYCPPTVPVWKFKALAQGHFQVLEAPDDTVRLAYTARRHYDDYEIGDGHGHVDGRRGLHLGQPGVQVLEALRTSIPAVVPTEHAALLTLTSHPPVNTESADHDPSTTDETTRTAPPSAGETTDGLPADHIGTDEHNTQQGNDPPGESGESEPKAAETTSGEATGDATPIDADADATTDADADTTTQSAAANNQKSPRAPRPLKAVRYGVWPSARQKLEALRASLGTDTTQADAVDHLLKLAEAGEQATRRLEVPPEQLVSRLVEMGELLKAREHHLAAREEQIDRLRKEVAELYQQMGGLKTQLAQAEAQILALQQQATQPEPTPTGNQGAAPGVSNAQPFDVGLHASLFGLASSALTLIQHLSQVPLQGHPAPTPPIAPTSPGTGTTPQHDPGGQTSPPSRAGTTPPAGRRGPATSPTPRTVAHAATARAAGDPAAGASSTPSPSPPQRGGEPSAPSSTPPSAETTGAKRGSAEERIHRAVQAVIHFNEGQQRREDKWAINQSSLSRLTGANRPALQRYLEQHAEAIQQHNEQHGLTERHNTAKGRRGEDIRQQIQF